MRSFFTFFGILFAGISAAWACSCLPAPPPAEAFAKADSVFAGKVESIQRSGEHELKVSLRVLENWKGTNAPTLVVYTASDGAMCGYHFARGEEYLVYARKNRGADGTKLTTGLCGRNARLSDAAEDLRFLRKEAKPLPQ